MENILFDNVFVNNPGLLPWGDPYCACSNVNETTQGNTELPPAMLQVQNISIII